MEILDIYDSNRMPTGRTFVRGTKPEGGYYLVAQVIVFNTKGQMLIQQRQAHKLGWPNRWDVSAGGSAARTAGGIGLVSGFHRRAPACVLDVY